MPDERESDEAAGEQRGENLHGHGRLASLSIRAAAVFRPSAPNELQAGMVNPVKSLPGG
jgi:hypothetical protein